MDLTNRERRERERFEAFYRRKWDGHEGFWEDAYPPEQRVYATAVYGRRNAAILAEAGIHVGTVLDLGCGVGDLADLIAQRADRTVAADVAFENVRRARRNLERAPTPTVVVQAQGERLPFTGAAFDLIIVADVIEHVVSVEHTFREAARVLRPGGRLICVTPIPIALHAWRFADRIAWRLARPGRASRPGWRHSEVNERFLSKGQLRTALRAAGLRPVRFRRICFYPAPETPGAFGALMARMQQRDPSSFDRTASRILRAFAWIERRAILNQKQLWVAER